MKFELYFDKKIIFSLWIIIGFIVFLHFRPQQTAANEIAEIKASSNLSRQVELYRQLIKKIGPEAAQNELFRSGLPFTGQTHLLNHTVGDYLYEEYGTSGLLQCKDYFLSSCHHGFILHAIGNGGMPEVTETLNICRANGGAIFTQCAHAVGHGFLAYQGYKNLVQALETCDKTVETVKDFPLFNCYDGIFMENIWAVHDGEPSPDRWVKPEDKHFPCNDPRIAYKYLLGCWSNQPALAYQLFRGDISRVPAVCMELTDEKLKEMCFNGLARQIHPITGSASEVLQQCSLMTEEKWINYCIVINATSFFSVGDRTLPFEICSAIGEADKNSCFRQLFDTMNIYIGNKQEFHAVCLNISDYWWRNECVNSYYK